MSTANETQLKTIVRELRAVRKQLHEVVDILQTNAQNSDRFISVHDAALIMHRSTDYVYELVRSGRLGASRVSPKGKYQLSENEVRRYAPITHDQTKKQLTS